MRVLLDDNDFTPKTVDRPLPAPGQILIKTKAAAINPIDVKVTAGDLDVGGAGWAQPIPFTPGYDVAGVVEQVGKGVENFQVGDEVFASNWALDEGQFIGQHDDNVPDSQFPKGPIG